jgi:purine-binding chemotaxis protein CheW
MHNKNTRGAILGGKVMADQTMDILNLQFAGLGFGNQQLVFLIGSEEFGVDALQVKELIRYSAPVKVPNAPPTVRGVINFRGEVIPVLDMRMIFQLEPGKYNEYTVIVVVETGGKIFGLIVDRVLDMISLAEENIQPTPEFSSKEKTKYLKSMGKFGNQLILMLNLEKVVDFHEIDEIFPLKNNTDDGSNILNSLADPGRS